VDLGVDILEVAYPYTLAEQGLAAIFPIDPRKGDTCLKQVMECLNVCVYMYICVSVCVCVCF